MGFISKVTRAVTLWTNASVRRAEVLSEAIFYGVGMAMIGVVFTILAATGTFPSSVATMKAHNTFGLTLSKYVLYALSGVCAYLAATSARGSLRKGRPTTGAKLLLVLGAAAAGASAVMTVVAMIISSSNSQHPTPVWVYIIQALVVILRLLFLSVLVMAIYTLLEADHSPEVADIVAGLAPTPLPTSKAPHTDPAAGPGAAAYPAPQIVQHPMDAAAAPQVLHTLPAGAAPHAYYYPQQPMPPQQAYYYPPQPMPVQAPTAANGAFAAAPVPVAGWHQPGGPQPQMAAAGWAQPQPGGHFVPAQPPPAAMGVAGAAPATQRGGQGPSMLTTFVAFRMGQRAGRRQVHRMARRC